jgi:long-chain acyl-CoA synthetase
MTDGCGTIVELLARVPRDEQQRGGVVVCRDDGRREGYSWAEVAARACRAADGLTRQGVGAGDRVALAAGNSLEWIVADFAVHMIGGVLVPLHLGLSGEQLAWQIEHSGSRLVLNPAAILELIAAGHEAAGRALWEQTQQKQTPQTLASIVYTSGTSGEPKGVMLTQGNLAANAQQTVEAFGGRSDDCRLNSLPFSHAYGRMSDLYVSLCGNTRLALGQGRDQLAADAQRVQPTLLVVVPLLLSRLRQTAIAQFGAEDASAIQKLLGGQVRGFICGGARLAGELFDWYAAQGTPVWEGYGLTEAGPIVSLSSEQGCRRDSVGQCLPGTMVEIAGDGELLVSGPQVMAGYWRDETATREVLHNGWLHTGDLASFDEDSFLFLHGRKKEFIALSSGKKVWAAEIEGLWADDPLIAQIMLVGEGQSSLGALVVLKRALANSSANRDRLVNYLAQPLRERPAHEQIRHVWLLDEPWTASRGELTPKLTLRRPVILARNADGVRAMFSR